MSSNTEAVDIFAGQTAHLKGEVLTIIDAAMEGVRGKAVKDLISKAFRDRLTYVSRTWHGNYHAVSVEAPTAEYRVVAEYPNGVSEEISERMDKAILAAMPQGMPYDSGCMMVEPFMRDLSFNFGDNEAGALHATQSLAANVDNIRVSIWDGQQGTRIKGLEQEQQQQRPN